MDKSTIIKNEIRELRNRYTHEPEIQVRRVRRRVNKDLVPLSELTEENKKFITATIEKYKAMKLIPHTFPDGLTVYYKIRSISKRTLHLYCIKFFQCSGSAYIDLVTDTFHEKIPCRREVIHDLVKERKVVAKITEGRAYFLPPDNLTVQRAIVKKMILDKKSHFCQEIVDEFNKKNPNQKLYFTPRQVFRLKNGLEKITLKGTVEGSLNDLATYEQGLLYYIFESYNSKTGEKDRVYFVENKEIAERIRNCNSYDCFYFDTSLKKVSYMYDNYKILLLTGFDLKQKSSYLLNIILYQYDEVELFRKIYGYLKITYGLEPKKVATDFNLESIKGLYDVFPNSEICSTYHQFQKTILIRMRIMDMIQKPVQDRAKELILNLSFLCLMKDKNEIKEFFEEICKHFNTEIEQKFLKEYFEPFWLSNNKVLELLGDYKGGNEEAFLINTLCENVHRNIVTTPSITKVSFLTLGSTLRRIITASNKGVSITGVGIDTLTRYLVYLYERKGKLEIVPFEHYLDSSTDFLNAMNIDKSKFPFDFVSYEDFIEEEVKMEYLENSISMNTTLNELNSDLKLMHIIKENSVTFGEKSGLGNITEDPSIAGDVSQKKMAVEDSVDLSIKNIDVPEQNDTSFAKDISLLDCIREENEQEFDSFQKPITPKKKIIEQNWLISK